MGVPVEHATYIRLGRIGVSIIKAISLMAEIETMKAENAERIANGHSPAYGVDDFKNMQVEIHALTKGFSI